MDKFSIVIPIYNEGLIIKKLVDEIFFSLSDYKDKFEIILVDDSSTDNSFLEIKKIYKKYKEKIIVISNKFNIGQSFSIVKGIKRSNYNVIITLDGDGQNNPQDIPKLLNVYFDKNLSLIGGIRSKREDNIIKIISSKIANNIRKIILKDNCDDTGCSLKVFDKKTFMQFPHFNGIHRFLPALFYGYGKKTFFVDVSHRRRVYGISKYGTFKRLFGGIRDIIKVYKIIKEFKNKSD